MIKFQTVEEVPAESLVEDSAKTMINKTLQHHTF
jgi:hypothetical protein